MHDTYLYICIFYCSAHYIVTLSTELLKRSENLEIFMYVNSIVLNTRH